MSAAAKTAGAVGRDLRTFLGKRCVRIARFAPGILFDQNFETGFGEIRNYGRDQRHPPLARETLFWNADDHNTFLPSNSKRPILYRTADISTGR